MSTTPPPRADSDLLTLIAAWVGDGKLSLADLVYEGEPDIFKVSFKKPKGGELTTGQQAHNAALRSLGERANSLLKTTYKVLRHYQGCPWRLGRITAAALVLLRR